MTTNPKLRRAHWAEELVAADRQADGWQILARNFRRRGFELDIIAARGDTLSILEVKFRQSPPYYGSDLAALLGPRKLAALQRGARGFLSTCAEPLPASTRLDLALVCPQTRASIGQQPGTQNDKNTITKLITFKGQPAWLIVYYAHIAPLDAGFAGVIS